MGFDERRLIAERFCLSLESNEKNGFAHATQANYDQALGGATTLDSGQRNLCALKYVMTPGKLGRWRPGAWDVGVVSCVHSIVE